jgi:hypothetical protein
MLKLATRNAKTLLYMLFRQKSFLLLLLLLLLLHLLFSVDFPGPGPGKSRKNFKIRVA